MSTWRIELIASLPTEKTSDPNSSTGEFYQTLIKEIILIRLYKFLAKKKKEKIFVAMG